MLQIQTVDPKLLAGLKFLMTEPQLANYRLVGGTALALQFGHRHSVDIELFGTEEFDQDKVILAMSAFAKVDIISRKSAIFTCLLGGVKTDFVKYPYAWIDDILEIDGIRMATAKEIAAMKLNAIAGRGAKKDFIDLNLLLDQFTLKEMLQFYKAKYNQNDDFMVKKSLSYFADADKQSNPEMMSAYNWEGIKDRIVAALQKESLIID